MGFEKYKEERAKILRSMDRKQSRIDEALIRCMLQFNEDEGETLIDVRDFATVPLGERYYINKGIYIIPIEFGDDEWLFYTSIKPGYFLGLHEHPVGEICRVIKGVMVDKADYNKEYKAGETAVWPANTIHKPGAKMSSERLELLVIFDVSNLEPKVNLTPADR